MKQIFFLATFFGLFLISTRNASAQTEVSVYLQPDSPLQILNTTKRERLSSNFQAQEITMITVEFNIQNISNKPIRAYTIREFSREFDSDVGAVVSSYRLRPDGFLKPNQFANEQIGEFDLKPTPQSYKLGVDFIEFTDGTTWGKDLSNSSQLFAGIKSGIKKILESIKKLKQQGGFESLIKKIDEMKELTSPDGQSDSEKRGFRIGVNGIKSQIKRTYEKGGEKGAEVELQKFYDDYLDK